jgi:1-deoxy-D-xylulose-5-phosphate reductoisomerase
MQKIALLGSTGSIGTSTLNVISRFPDRFNLVALSTNSNIDLLSLQARRFRPQAVCVVDTRKAGRFRGMMKKGKMKLYEGEEGLQKMLEDIKIDALVVGIVGSSALLPILTSLDKIKTLVLANKEALVIAGNIIIRKAKKMGVKILPVDSEHSAIFQCLESRRQSEIKKIYLTGSGGPLLRLSKKAFKDMSPERAIHHPKWKMGRKISVDSATMMNKGLEVIEAHHLFGVGIDRIEVLIHPETLVHSMVEFVDGSILAQMGRCDMRIPIQYALTYPSRFSSPVKGVNFSSLGTIHFYLPDFKKFPCLEIAYEVARRGGTHPCVLNASNEVAVERFLRGEIRFTDIPKVIGKVLRAHRAIKDPGLEDILETDEWARRRTGEFLE